MKNETLILSTPPKRWCKENLMGVGNNVLFLAGIQCTFQQMFFWVFRLFFGGKEEANLAIFSPLSFTGRENNTISPIQIRSITSFPLMMYHFIEKQLPLNSGQYFSPLLYFPDVGKDQISSCPEMQFPLNFSAVTDAPDICSQEYMSFWFFHPIFPRGYGKKTHHGGLTATSHISHLGIKF